VAHASAKVILFGEHAVVHGRVAVAAALDRGARATASFDAARSVLELEPWGRVSYADDAEDEVGRAYAAVLEASGVDAPVRTRASVDVPGGAGLGCSAAIGVAVVRAVADARAESIDDDEVARRATAWERVFHGNPSGVDVAIAARGGLLAFKKGEPPRPLYPPFEVPIAVAFTGECSSTKSMVEHVARQLARRPSVVERSLDAIDVLAKKGAAAIEAGMWHELGRLMDLNHSLLAALMLSTEKLERACDLARRAGASGAKLTGAGGGGCAIALAPAGAAPIVEAWRAEGYECFEARIGPRVALVGAVGGSLR
jgi:mevalonate kinase